MHVAGGSAAWEPATNRLLHAQGSAWHCLNWFGEKDGQPAVWPLELGPPALLPDGAAAKPRLTA